MSHQPAPYWDWYIILWHDGYYVHLFKKKNCRPSPTCWFCFRANPHPIPVKWFSVQEQATQADACTYSSSLVCLIVHIIWSVWNGIPYRYVARCVLSSLASTWHEQKWRGFVRNCCALQQYGLTCLPLFTVYEHGYWYVLSRTRYILQYLYCNKSQMLPVYFKVVYFIHTASTRSIGSILTAKKYCQ